MQQSKKNILVLGGSYLQSDFVQVAIGKGHVVHVVDRNPDCYLSKFKGVSFAVVDISDLEAVNSYFLDGNFDIIISPVTEIGNRVSSIIAARHGLLYNSEETVRATTDKRIMREKLKTSGLPEPRVIILQESDDLKKIEIPFPAIVKPSVSSASRGVTQVRNRMEFISAIERASKYCNSINDIIVEEYIGGDQYSIETISSHGEHFTVAIVQENLSGAPYFMERMDVINAEINKRLFNAVQKFITQLLNSLNVQFGPCHIEVKIDEKKQLRLIEVASRSGLLRDRLVRTAKGSEYNDLILKSYSGEKLTQPALPETNGMLGIIVYPEDMDAYKRSKEDLILFDAHLNGFEMAEKPTMLTDAVGYYFIRSKEISIFENYKTKY